MEWKEIGVLDIQLIEILERIDKKKIRLDAAKPLPKIALEKIKEHISLEWTYNSNGIEGNTLSLHETRIIIEDGMTIKGKSMREHFEALNHQDAIEYIESLAQKNSLFQEIDILSTHQLVLDKIEKEFSGRYRNGGVRISGANFIPPNALKIHELIYDLVNWTNEESKSIHPLLKATLFHHRFVWIHPFFDGNGRTARLLFNLILLKHKYPPAIILKNDRKKYYDALNKANKGDYNKLALLMLQATERTINLFLNAIESSEEDYKSIQDIIEESEIKYGQEYVSLLARQGKIDAYKEGRVWYTTESAINNYIKHRKRKRELGD